MKVGRAIRTRLGRFEEPVSSTFRSLFVDLDECARLLAESVSATRILEIGCGDGQLAGPLLERFPATTYDGIDVAPEVGRLFRGERARATFRSVDTGTLRDEHPDPFDLVLVMDVLHHVPPPARDGLLADMRGLTTIGGHYAVKEWTRAHSFAHLAAWSSDRLLTGDRVSYFEDGELRALLADRFPGDPCVLAARVGPRPNNLLLVHRRAS